MAVKRTTRATPVDPVDIDDSQKAPSVKDFIGEKAVSSDGQNDSKIVSQAEPEVTPTQTPVINQPEASHSDIEQKDSYQPMQRDRRNNFNGSFSTPAQIQSVPTETVLGYLDIQPEGHGFLRPKFIPSSRDIYISQSQIRQIGRAHV